MGKTNPLLLSSSLGPTATQPKNTVELPSRVFQLTHQLPVISVLMNDNTWVFKQRPGHSALFSGIKSLSALTKNINVGYVGLIVKQDGSQIDCTLLAEEDKMKLQGELFKNNDCIPIFIDNKTANEYYQGYCKSGKSNNHRTMAYLALCHGRS